MPRGPSATGMCHGAPEPPLHKKRRLNHSSSNEGKRNCLQGTSSSSHPPPPYLSHLSAPKNISEIYYYVPEWTPPQGSWHCGCLSGALEDATTLQPYKPESFSFQKFCQEILHRPLGAEDGMRVVHAQILLTGNSKEYWCFVDDGGFKTFLLLLDLLSREEALSQAGVSVVFCELDGPPGLPGAAWKLPSPDPRFPGFE